MENIKSNVKKFDNGHTTKELLLAIKCQRLAEYSERLHRAISVISAETDDILQCNFDDLEKSAFVEYVGYIRGVIDSCDAENLHRLGSEKDV